MFDCGLEDIDSHDGFGYSHQIPKLKGDEEILVQTSSNAHNRKSPFVPEGIGKKFQSSPISRAEIPNTPTEPNPAQKALRALEQVNDMFYDAGTPVNQLANGMLSAFDVVGDFFYGDAHPRSSFGQPKTRPKGTAAQEQMRGKQHRARKIMVVKGTGYGASSTMSSAELESLERETASFETGGSDDSMMRDESIEIRDEASSTQVDNADPSDSFVYVRVPKIVKGKRVKSVVPSLKPPLPPKTKKSIDKKVPVPTGTPRKRSRKLPRRSSFNLDRNSKQDKRDHIRQHRHSEPMVPVPVNQFQASNKLGTPQNKSVSFADLNLTNPKNKAKSAQVVNNDIENVLGVDPSLPQLLGKIDRIRAKRIQQKESKAKQLRRSRLARECAKAKPVLSQASSTANTPPHFSQLLQAEPSTERMNVGKSQLRIPPSPVVRNLDELEQDFDRILQSKRPSLEKQATWSESNEQTSPPFRTFTRHTSATRIHQEMLQTNLPHNDTMPVYSQRERELQRMRLTIAKRLSRADPTCGDGATPRSKETAVKATHTQITKAAIYSQTERELERLRRKIQQRNLVFRNKDSDAGNGTSPKLTFIRVGNPKHLKEKVAPERPCFLKNHMAAMEVKRDHIRKSILDASREPAMMVGDDGTPRTGNGATTGKQSGTRSKKKNVVRFELTSQQPKDSRLHGCGDDEVLGVVDAFSNLRVNKQSTVGKGMIIHRGQKLISEGREDIETLKMRNVRSRALPEGESRQG